jgi:hypothetical protein
MSDWLEAVVGELGLGPRSQTIHDALQDVAALTAGRSAVTWLDRREGPTVTVYVLCAGVLHRVVAEADGDSEDARSTVTVEYETRPVTRRATFTLAVTRESDPALGMNVTKAWEFAVGERESAAGFEFTVSYTGERSRSERFAHELARTIAYAP